MLIKRAADIRSSEITDKKLYLNRREFLRQSAGSVATAAAIGALGAEALVEAATPAPHGRKLAEHPEEPLSTTEKTNSWERITTYNNYYEFGIDKDSPSMLAKGLKPIAVDGVGGRRVREKGRNEPRGHPQGRDARGADLSPPMRRALVDGDSVGRLSARELHQEVRADVESEVRRIHRR